LYKIGSEKIGELAANGVKNLLSASQSTIRKGFGFAGGIVRKYIHINRNMMVN
jgi:hypothetical protein